MSMYEPATLSRGIDVILIPAGTKSSLEAGTALTVTQALGGTYTAVTDRGEMVRVSAKDADALDLPPPEGAAPTPAEPPDTKEKAERAVWDQLRTVYDPEIPASVVDLGLVYGCVIEPHPEGGWTADVTMTLTAPGCGMGDVLKADAETRIESIPGLKAARVQVVVDPPWHQGLMSEAARLQLGLM